MVPTMERSRTIDIHAHMLPQETMRRLAGESLRVAPKLVEQDDGSTIMEIAGKVVQRPVELGVRGEALFDGRVEAAVEIVSGAADGATLLRGTAGAVRDGTPVRLATAVAVASAAAPASGASAAR